jgi:hypothetical protein
MEQRGPPGIVRLADATVMKSLLSFTCARVCRLVYGRGTFGMLGNGLGPVGLIPE